jgi:hypothetical protein
LRKANENVLKLTTALSIILSRWKEEIIWN